MADLTVASISRSGVDPGTLTAAAAGGDTATNDGETFLHVNNGGGSSVTVTVDAQLNCDQGFDHDVAVAVPAGEDRFIGPFPKRIFNNSNGKVDITYSGVTSVTVGAYKLGS